MDHRQGRSDRGLGQVRKVVEELGRHEHALVDHSARGAGGHVELQHEVPRLLCPALSPFPDEVEPSFQLVPGLTAAIHEGLAHAGFALPGQGAQAPVPGGDVPPADDAQAEPAACLLEAGLARFRRGLLPGQEEHGHAVVTGGRQHEAQALSFGGKEFIGDLEKDPGAIAGALIAAHGAAVLHVHQHVLGHVEDGVVLAAGDAHHRADAARVVLVPGIIEAYGLGLHDCLLLK